jgi:dipeptidyl aminopeptidase/acylaminoacyl peptidase
MIKKISTSHCTLRVVFSLWTGSNITKAPHNKKEKREGKKACSFQLWKTLHGSFVSENCCAGPNSLGDVTELFLLSGSREIPSSDKRSSAALHKKLDEWVSDVTQFDFSPAGATLYTLRSRFNNLKAKCISSERINRRKSNIRIFIV